MGGGNGNTSTINGNPAAALTFAASSAAAASSSSQRRYPLPFVGAKVRRFIGGFMPLLQRLRCQLLLGTGGFDLGTVQALREDHPTDPDARALRILQGRAEPLPKRWHTPAGRETWMVQAARDGVLELVKGLRAEGCPWDERTCEVAAEGGHLEVLQWLRAEGCPLIEDMQGGSGGRPPGGPAVGEG